MPRGNRTGPMGQGPITGRGAGFCAGYALPGYANNAAPGCGGRFGAGNRFGNGRGMGFRGRGFGFQAAQNVALATELTPENEKKES